jgi:hypothetical protein
MHHADLDRDEADRVAVGSGRGDGLMADYARSTGAIDDIDRLAEVLLHQRRQDARHGVRSAARGPGHDQRDWAIRIGCEGRSRHGEPQRHGTSAKQAHQVLHRSPPCVQSTMSL